MPQYCFFSETLSPSRKDLRFNYSRNVYKTKDQCRHLPLFGYVFRHLNLVICSTGISIHCQLAQCQAHKKNSVGSY